MRMHKVERFKLQVARFSLLLTAFFMVGFLLITVNLYAAGDLIVEGNVGVGTTTLTGKLNVLDATKVPLIIDNSTGTQNILEVKANGPSEFGFQVGGYLG